jgi:hypothetical protein
VASLAGASAKVGAAKFTYLTVPTTRPTNPQIVSPIPPQGPVGGGTVVTINGTHLDDNSLIYVRFGTGASNNATINSHSAAQIICTTNNHSSGAGTVNVTIRNGDGTTTITNGYTFMAPLTITASAGANGTISPLGAVSVNYGADQAFTITPATHYHVSDVLVDGSSVGAVTSYTFHTVKANHTIAASFAQTTHTITASAGTNGSISPSGAVIVNDGANQSFTITPDAHYHVADVLVDGVSVGAVTSYTFTGVTADHTIAASFAIDTNIITASAGANGSITPSGAVSVNYGADQTFTITPAANYHVADVLVDGSSVGAVTSHTFTNVTTSHTISATFAINTSHIITASTGANGSISPSGAVTVNYGADQAFTITPFANYHVSDVLVDGVSVGAVTSYTFTNVTAAHTISATFAINTSHIITASTGANGSISPSGAVSVN